MGVPAYISRTVGPNNQIVSGKSQKAGVGEFSSDSREQGAKRCSEFVADRGLKQPFAISTSAAYRLVYTGYLKPLPGTGDRLISEHELERFLRSTRSKETA
jgi:hypothetical protein